MSAAAARPRRAVVPAPESHREWAELVGSAPQLAATMRRYLVQLTTFLAPRSVDAADSTLRQFARWLVDQHRRRRRRRHHPHATSRTTRCGSPRSPAPRARRWRRTPDANGCGMIRIFFERLIEWDWPDAPAATRSCTATSHRDPNRSPSSSPTTTPPSSWPPPAPTRSRATGSSSRSSPAPGYAPASSATSPPTPSPTSATPTGSGSRSASSATTATSRSTPTSSSSSPTGPPTNADHIRRHRRLLADDHAPDRPAHRAPHRRHASAATAGIGHVHPHQLRHTLATQAINRGMRLEAIAALLGHRSLEMTLIYARIADRVVADEYAAVCRPDRRPLQHRRRPRRAPRRDRDRRHDPPPPRSPRPHARQRPLHPPRRTRLPHGIRLRDLRLLPDRHPSSSPSSSANATTPATTTKPTAPPSSTTSSTHRPDDALDNDHPYNADDQPLTVDVCNRTARSLLDLPGRVPAQHLLEGDAAFHPGERGAEAEVDAVPERDVVVEAAMDVEPVGVGVLALVATGRPGDEQHLRVPRAWSDAVQLDVVL